MKFTMTGSRNNQTIKTKTWNTQPSKKSVRMLIDRYDNNYGGYLAYRFYINGKEVTKSEFLNAPLLTGKILWFSERDKNGVIIDENKNEYYFDISVVENRQLPEHPDYKQTNVTFELNEQIKHCRCAKTVKLASNLQ